MSDHEPQPMSDIHEILDREFGWNHKDAYLRGIAEEIASLRLGGPVTEPTRDALHAATLLALDTFGVRSMMTREERAHAAACVRRVPELEALAEFRRCELEAVRIENLGVRAENRRLEAEVERLRAKAANIEEAKQLMLTIIEATEKMSSVFGQGTTAFHITRDTLARCKRLLAPSAAATREGTN